MPYYEFIKITTNDSVNSVYIKSSQKKDWIDTPDAKSYLKKIKNRVSSGLGTSVDKILARSDQLSFERISSHENIEGEAAKLIKEKIINELIKSGENVINKNSRQVGKNTNNYNNQKAKSYKELFSKFEDGLIAHANRYMEKKDIEDYLKKFKDIEKNTDTEHYQTMVDVVFFSGFDSAVVKGKKPAIEKHLYNVEKTASYNEDDIKRIMSDDDMIRHKGKISACIHNARNIKRLSHKHNGFKNYIDSFDAESSEENLEKLREDLIKNFKFLGKITANHFLTDLGFNVIKPDRVVCRIFKRLGLIKETVDVDSAISEGIRFSESTNLPIRYIDIVFVAYGQVAFPELNIPKGICLETKPQCDICPAKTYCNL